MEASISTEDYFITFQNDNEGWVIHDKHLLTNQSEIGYIEASDAPDHRHYAREFTAFYHGPFKVNPAKRLGKFTRQDIAMMAIIVEHNQIRGAEGGGMTASIETDPSGPCDYMETQIALLQKELRKAHAWGDERVKSVLYDGQNHFNMCDISEGMWFVERPDTDPHYTSENSSIGNICEEGDGDKYDAWYIFDEAHEEVFLGSFDTPHIAAMMIVMRYNGVTEDSDPVVQAAIQFARAINDQQGT